MIGSLCYSKTYSLKRGYSVRFELSAGRFEAHWLPDIPPAHIAKRLRQRYRAARNDFVGSLGIPAAVIEI